jgi:hypothetical protein
MLFELHSLNLKVCRKQYYKICFEPDCGASAKQWLVTTQPKQGRLAGPISSLCIILCLWANVKLFMGLIEEWEQ